MAEWERRNSDKIHKEQKGLESYDGPYPKRMRHTVEKQTLLSYASTAPVSLLLLKITQFYAMGNIFSDEVFKIA